MSEEGTLDITGLDKAEVLAALYNFSNPIGMGFLQCEDKAMTVQEARVLLDRQDPGRAPYFDYLKGRVMKIELTDQLSVRLYERDNGHGSAKRALKHLKDF